MARDLLLTVNAGSSSLRCGLYPLDSTGIPVPQLKLHVDLADASAPPRVTVAGKAPGPGPVLGATGDAAAALSGLLDWLDHHGLLTRLAAAGHRVVHGGEHAGPARVTAALLSELRTLAGLAPLHQPNDLAAIHALAQHLPDCPQVACFDSAFHHGLPARARRLALPAEVPPQARYRVGFHGLSYESIATQLATIAPAERGVVVAHLGNGASLCALQDGRSVDTTMGATPLDGVPMGTRSGALDPGLLLWLLQEGGYAADELQSLLYRRAGLLGVSGESADMRSLLASPLPSAREAVELFCYRCAQALAAMAVALEQLETVVFTGGIGQHAAAVRARIVAHARLLGLELDPSANEAQAAIISAADSRVRLRVLATDEEGVIARQTGRVLLDRSGRPGDSDQT